MQENLPDTPKYTPGIISLTRTIGAGFGVYRLTRNRHIPAASKANARVFGRALPSLPTE